MVAKGESKTSGNAEAAVTKPRKEVRPRGAPRSDVNDSRPTSDPSVRLRFERGSTRSYPQDFIDAVVAAADRFGPIELKVKALEEEQGDDDKYLKRIGVNTDIRGVVRQPGENGEGGYDLQIKPAMSINRIDEAAFREGRSTLFQSTTHPEVVFILRLPDGYLGTQGPITAEKVYSTLYGLAIGLGFNPDDLSREKPDKERLLIDKRNLGADIDAIRAEIKAHGPIPGVETKITVSLEANPIHKGPLAEG